MTPPASDQHFFLRGPEHVFVSFFFFSFFLSLAHTLIDIDLPASLHSPLELRPLVDPNKAVTSR